VLRTGVEASAGIRVDVGAGDELRGVTCAGVPVLTGTEPGVAAGGGVAVVARAGGAETGGGVRAGGTAARGPSAGLRLGVDTGGELRAVACAGTSGGVTVLAGAEPSNSFRSELKTGVEASAGVRVDVRA
jgi:hypothetical protein